jgi:hypothetical protein
MERIMKMIKKIIKIITEKLMKIFNKIIKKIKYLKGIMSEYDYDKPIIILLVIIESIIIT